MEHFTLNNGTKIPLVGLGTFQMNPDEAEYAVVTALKKGYSQSCGQVCMQVPHKLSMKH